MEAVLERLGSAAASCAMVGDRLETDIHMAKRAGLMVILTLTGVTSRADLDLASTTPDHVVESIAELPTLDLELSK